LAIEFVENTPLFHDPEHYQQQSSELVVVADMALLTSRHAD